LIYFGVVNPNFNSLDIKELISLEAANLGNRAPSSVGTKPRRVRPNTVKI